MKKRWLYTACKRRLSMAAKVTSWSYSSWGLYKTCPKQYKLAKIDKIPGVPSPAAERGIAIHAKGEQYLLKRIPNVPTEFSTFKTELANLRAHNATAEQKYCVDDDWCLTEWGSKYGWLRFVIDAVVDLNPTAILVVDFKTGKVYKEHENQSELYATALMQIYPDVEEIFTEFWYLDQDVIGSWKYKRGVADDLRRYWEGRAEPMFKETEWRATPSEKACKWCKFRQICDDSWYA